MIYQTLFLNHLQKDIMVPFFIFWMAGWWLSGGQASFAAGEFVAHETGDAEVTRGELWAIKFDSYQMLSTINRRPQRQLTVRWTWVNCYQLLSLPILVKNSNGQWWSPSLINIRSKLCCHPVDNAGYDYIRVLCGLQVEKNPVWTFAMFGSVSSRRKLTWSGLNLDKTIQARNTIVLTLHEDYIHL